ncbi:transglycosylase SLT domain-containing protein [Candidatus Pacearchaeota archaeon]|nr:hypothetical protein [uncultured archaeon]MBS3084381.1 transglycosylase SLT domain-containing protein [Candidatus Pacearchaeota archaeon]
MKKGLLFLLVPFLIGGCATSEKITKENKDNLEKGTIYAGAYSDPMDSLKGDKAYIKAKEFLENAQRFYEEGNRDSSKMYFEKGTKLLSQSNLSSEDHNFIDFRESINNLEQYKKQKEAIENGIQLSKEEIEVAEKKFPMGEKFAEKVAHYEKLFETKKKEWFLNSLERFLQYEPFIDSILNEEKAPSLTKYMYPIESAMDLFAKSRVGAKGIAQFMEQTGKLWGLRILGLWYDERLDPLKAILASVDYINYLSSDFVDSNLAIASYNCGESRIINQLKRFNSFNFDELLEKKVLPEETLNHIPLIYAYKDLSERTVLENPKKNPILENLLTNNFDTVTIKKQTSFKVIAKILGISKEELKSYNPAYGFDATPPERMVEGEYSFEVRIPKGTKEKFYEKFANVKEKYEFEGGSYTIKNGDTLAEIAHIFKVSLYELKKANGFIDPKKLIPGRKIIIP